MTEKDSSLYEEHGILAIGVNEQGSIVIQLPNEGIRALVFTPAQARSLADALRKHADRLDSRQRTPEYTH